MTAKKSLALNLVLALTIVLPLASCAPRHLIATRTERLERAPARELAQVTAYNFDWDDNAFFMPTKIVLFNKKTGAEHPVTTGEFAEIRAHVGKDGEWTDYEIRLDDSTGSFRYFREGTQGQNYFLLDAAEGLKDVFDTLRETLKGKKEVVERLNSALEDLEGIREGRKEALARIPEIHANLLTALKGAKAFMPSQTRNSRAPPPTRLKSKPRS
ncbi:MAG: hypothetical protein HY074_06785 [Deltaproteobacteria bacterium]|nr:hypothetical protein [Deltaproteobacteria bacterium]